MAKPTEADGTTWTVTTVTVTLFFLRCTAPEYIDRPRAKNSRTMIAIGACWFKASSRAKKKIYTRTPDTHGAKLKVRD